MDIYPPFFFKDKGFSFRNNASYFAVQRNVIPLVLLIYIAKWNIYVYMYVIQYVGLCVSLSLCCMGVGTGGGAQGARAPPPNNFAK